MAGAPVYTRGNAIRDLMHLSYTWEEAERTLDEPDKEKRYEICQQVQDRVRRKHDV